MTGIITLMIGLSSIMSWVMAFTGLPDLIANGILSLTGNKYVILILMNIILLIVGTFMDPTPAVLIFTPIFLPICKTFGIIYIHPDSETIPTETLALIRKLGKHPGIVINPGVSLETVQELFPLVDYVLVMTVDPGFAGRDYLPYVETKIKRLVEIRRQYGFHIVIDGGVTWEVLHRLWGYGVEGFVLGKQILFGQNEPYDKIIQKVRSI